MSNDLSPEEVDALSKAMGSSAGEGTAPAKSGATATAPEPKTSPSASAKGSGISRAQLMQLEELAAAADLPPKELERMYDIKVQVEVLLGHTKMALEKILKLNPGSVVELDRLAGEPVDIVANGKLIARAELVVIEENFGVKILEIVGTKQKLSVMTS